MLPIVSHINNLAPTPTSPVATPLLNTTALRAPADSVAPSVSNAEVNNNARGNTPLPEDAKQVSIPVSLPAQARAAQDAAAKTSSAPITTPTVSAPFIAQLAAQQPAPALQSALTGVLTAYDKLVSYGFTKYKPAQEPLPKTSTAFSQALAQERAARGEVEPPPPPPQDALEPVQAVEAKPRD